MRESEVIAEPTDAAAPIDLELALDELFATPPEAFVAARNALAKALRGEKRRVEAGAVAAYRRPGRTAGALNRLVLSGDPTFAALLDAVEAVRVADAESYREAVAGLREATAGAVDATLAGFADERSEDRGDLTMALQAIVGDDAALHALARGRLEDVPAAGLGGFGGFGGLGGPAPDAVPAREAVARRRPRLPDARGAAAPSEPTPAADDEADAEIDDPLARRRAEKVLRTATAAAEKAERAVAAAEADAGAAGEALAAADAEVAAAEAALERAQAEQQAAANAAAAAEESLEQARAAAAEAAEDLEAATSDLEALD